ncbi:hypothetical protein C8Q80DRAFT_1160217 [Daedaleopsis nitida]|nr:hypothetical protein C8Q80DRAFT_1160217 [Daedaleopsis nitida]
MRYAIGDRHLIAVPMVCRGATEVEHGDSGGESPSWRPNTHPTASQITYLRSVVCDSGLVRRAER